MTAPGEVLLSRALHFLQGAKLQLQAGDYIKTADAMDKAVAVLKELTTR